MLVSIDAWHDAAFDMLATALPAALPRSLHTMVDEADLDVTAAWRQPPPSLVTRATSAACRGAGWPGWAAMAAVVLGRRLPPVTTHGGPAGQPTRRPRRGTPTAARHDTGRPSRTTNAAATPVTPTAATTTTEQPSRTTNAAAAARYADSRRHDNRAAQMRNRRGPRTPVQFAAAVDFAVDPDVQVINLPLVMTDDGEFRRRARLSRCLVSPHKTRFDPPSVR